MEKQTKNYLEIGIIIIFLINGFFGMFKMLTSNFFEGFVQMGICFIIAKLSLISIDIRHKKW